MTLNISERITSLIMNLMDKHSVPGLSVSVIKEDEIVFERGFGYRNLDQLIPMTKDTLAGIGSISKSFTALAVLQLQEKGLLSIEDPIVQYFPWFPQNPQNPVLLKHLLSHSTGLPAIDGTILESLHHIKRHINFTPIVNRSDLEWYIKNAENERLFDPGEHFFYNNDMYTLVGYLIEDLTGKKFVEYIRENILKPLAMDRTSYSLEEVNNDSLSDASTGYAIKDKKVTTFTHQYSDLQNAPGGILSSAHEMTHYIQFILQKGKFEGNVLLREENMELLWQPIILSPYTSGTDMYYCLGWNKGDFFGRILIQHSGGLWSSTARLSILPEDNIGVFAIENDAKGTCTMIVDGILAILTGKDPEILPTFRYSRIISEVKGTYKSYRGVYSLRVEMKDGLLWAHLEIDDGEFDAPLIIKDAEKLTFTIPVGAPELHREIRFLRDKTTNKAVHATYDRYLYHRIT
ncbi:MAG: serine hydrolase [Promethearchaeota archaeon]